MSKLSRPAQTQIEVHIEETTWVDVSPTSASDGACDADFIQGHALPYKSEGGSDTELDDKAQNESATIGSSTRLTGTGRVYV